MELYPFDWSQQLGATQKLGISTWQEDWVSGRILFDPSISVYPARFGYRYEHPQKYLSSFEEDTVGTVPDTTFTNSQIHYTKGDWGINVFEARADYFGDQRQISFHGFKRSHPGSYGHFIRGSGEDFPIQQSYRVDYTSTLETTDIEISAAKFSTGMGIYDTTANRNTFKDDITSAGLGMKTPIGNSELQLSAMHTNRIFTLGASFFPVLGKYSMARSRIGADVLFKTGNRLFIALNRRILSPPGAELVEQKWSSGGFVFHWNAFKLKAGGVVSVNDGLQPIAGMSYSTEAGKWSNRIDLASDWFPNPILLDSVGMGHRMQQSTTATIQTGFSGEKNQLTIYAKSKSVNHYVDGSSLLSHSPSEDRRTSATGIGFSGSTSIWKIRLETEFLHQFNTSTLSLGFTDRILFGTSGDLPLFDGNLLAKLSLQIEGVLGRNPNWRMDPYSGIPFLSSTSSTALKDYWLGHASVEAHVSTFTMIWSVNNVVHATENLWESTDLAIPVITSNEFLPPMNQLIQVQIIWNFND